MPTPDSFTNPVLDQDFPDPDVLKIGDVYYDRRYATGYAVADDIFGPYVKAKEPLLETNLAAGLVGPGGQDIVTGPRGGTWILFHGWAPDGYRRLHLAPLDWQNGVPALGLNGRDPLPMP